MRKACWEPGVPGLRCMLGSVVSVGPLHTGGGREEKSGARPGRLRGARAGPGAVTSPRSGVLRPRGQRRFMRPKLLPVLEPGAVPQRATWYTLVPLGESPSARVGHNCLYLPPVPAAGKGKVVIIGGADPNGSFSDAHIIDLDKHQWAMPGWVGLLPRYEHATFIPTSSPTSLWVFGGADQSGNRNCVQVLNLETGIWESPKVIGTQPLPRTFHTSSAAIGDQLYVLGGGDKGAEPVKDPQLHVFDTATLTWSQPEVHGNPPSPRHGHVVVAVGTKLFIHGGLSGDKFYNDLFCIDTNVMTWEKLPAAGDVPGGRAAHSAAAFGNHLYIFGGMDPTGALDTMYKYHIENQQWTLLEFDSPLPPGRLDHSMCIVPWQVCVNVKNSDSEAVTSRNTIGKEATETVSDEGDSDQEKQIGKGCTEDKLMYLFLIFGGMDTQGEIHRDCLVNLIK
ncbi:rab9 effector protein with kelch motifs [Chelonia mydas]|uniref:rab9 effector protein with kelch motifs n=1 Tax=Chelonia mydas TaxID=8469 RepID=UPI0018A1E197|nr:rab9 effector protein with kelch motifs [Chelonia mydas]